MPRRVLWWYTDRWLWKGVLFPTLKTKWDNITCGCFLSWTLHYRWSFWWWGDNVEHSLFKGILYCERLICVPWVWNSLFHTYCSPMYTAQLWWYYNNLPLGPTKLQIAYHNIYFNVFWHVQIWNTSYLCTVFVIQYCKPVTKQLVYGFMCRLDSSVNYIIKNILATSLRYTSRIYVNTGVVYFILIRRRVVF